MTSDLQAIAIEQRWCQSCPSGNLPTAGPVPWLGGPALMRPPGWRELRRKTCVCGNLHRAGALGHVFAYTAPDLRRSRKAFRSQDAGPTNRVRPVHGRWTIDGCAIGGYAMAPGTRSMAGGT